MNILTQPSVALVENHFNELAPGYDAKAANRESYLKAIDRIIVDHIGQTGSSEGRLLDIGTGTGTRLEGLKKQLPGIQVHGCDLSPVMVEIASTKDLDGIQVANMSSLPYGNEAYDYLLSLFNVFGYAPSKYERQAAVGEFYRILKPGGSIIIDVLNRWHTGEGASFQKTRSQIIKELARSAFSNDLELGDVMFPVEAGKFSRLGFFHSFTDQEVRRLFMGTGFQIKNVYVVGYDTGRIHKTRSRGNLAYVFQKPE